MGPQWIGATEHNRWLAWETRALLRYARSAAVPSGFGWIGKDGSVDTSHPVELWITGRMTFAFSIGTLLGIVMGALQGYFAGRVDITLQRLIEVWSAIPELYLLLILASMFEPSIWVLLVILSLFGWMGLSDYVRAEFLRNRQLEFVQAARALGLPRRTIILRHILPNSLTPVLAFLPFRMSAAIVALASLDFLGLGVSDSSPSLGELLAQGKNNLDAWWIALPTFGVLVGTLLLLIFIGEALRDALDPRKR